MEKQVDPRVKRTRECLKEALIQLIEKKGFDAITVRDLTIHAGINRATFYQHYKDKYDLLDQNIDHMILAMVTYVAPKKLDDILVEGEDSSPSYERLFEFISENVTFFKVMLGKNGVPAFGHQLLVMMRKFISLKLDALHPNPNQLGIPKDIFLYYVSSANVGIINYWLESGMIYSPKYMAKQLTNLLQKGPLHAIGLYD